MFEIIGIIFAISVPILYLRGLWSLFQRPKEPQSRLTVGDDDWSRQSASRSNQLLHERIKALELERQKERELWEELEIRAEAEPEITLRAILDEYFPEAEVIAESESAEEIEDSSVDSEDEAPVKTLAQMMHIESPRYEQSINLDKMAVVEEAPQEKAPKQAPQFIEAEEQAKEGFNWGNWYTDNAINLLLFLGAFLVVAAVSFFLSIQWGNLNGAMRFGIVVAFTGAWYVAGFFFNRGESFKTVGITFITIGAVLLPFCGIAYQQFIIGSMAGVGLTWLITSVVSTVTYMALSLIFQRRYFTYFGALSILAMLLALVQVADAPQSYFVLAGTVTALILLVGRISLRYFPYLDNYMGQDYEISSVISLVLSIVAGIALLPVQGIPFFSIEVTIVAVSTVIYLWVYASLHDAEVNLFALGAQALTIFTVVHGTIALELSPSIILLISLGAQLVLQVILHLVYRNNDNQLLYNHTISLVATAVIYGISVVLLTSAIPDLLYAVILMVQLSYYALRFDYHALFFAVVALSFAVLGHSLQIINLDYAYWGYAFMTLGVIELVGAYLSLPNYLRQPMRYLSLIVIAGSGYSGFAFISEDNSMNSYILNYIAMIVMSIFAFVEERQEEKLVAPVIHVVSAFVGFVYYVSSFIVPLDFPQAGLAILMTIQLIGAYRHFRQSGFAMLIAGACYPVLWYLMIGFGVESLTTIGFAFAILATVHVATLYSNFADSLKEGLATVGMFALGASVFAMSSANLLESTLRSFSWFSIGMGFFAIAVYGLVNYLEAEREETLLSPYMHLLGVLAALALTIPFGWFNLIESDVYAFVTAGYFLAAIILLVLNYRHVAHMLYIVVASLLGYFALGAIAYGLNLSWEMMSLIFVIYSASLLRFAFLPVNEAIQQATRGVGIIGISGWMGFTAFNLYRGLESSVVSLITIWIGIVVCAVFEESQRRIEYPVEISLLRFLPMLSLAGIYMLSTVSVDFITVFYALALSIYLFQHYLRTQSELFAYAMIVMSYASAVNLLMALDVPYEVYPVVISILSIGLYTFRHRIIGEEAVNSINTIVLLALGLTSVASLQVGYVENSSAMHMAGWLSAYTLLAIFWDSKLVSDERTREGLLGVGIYLQYLWHIFYAQEFLNSNVFGDLQWLSAGLGLAILGAGIAESRRNEGKLPIRFIYVSAGVFLLPAYAQSLGGNWLYTGLAIAYSLIFVGIGIFFSNSRAQIIGTVGLIVALLIPTGEFLLNLPIWIFALLIGLGLIVAAIFLTMRRRSLKKIEP